MESRAEFLRQVSLDEELTSALRRDYTAAKVSPAERAMLDYVAKLTRDAQRVTLQDLDRLREHRFTDTAILQINLIASWFNYINRVADGLGVGKPG